MMDDTAIFHASASDLQTVHDIVTQTVSEIYPHYYPSGAVAFFLSHHNTDAIAADIAAGCVYLLNDADGRTVGTVTINENEINRLFVLPQAQGYGFGRLLLDFAEQEIWKQYEKITLSASFSAKPIYLKRGYQAVDFGKIPTESGDFLCFDTMEKTKTGGTL